MQLHTYLNYGGNCEEAFRFYEQHLGGQITMLMRHGEQPTPSETPAEWNGKVLHCECMILETARVSKPRQGLPRASEASRGERCPSG